MFLTGTISNAENRVFTAAVCPWSITQPSVVADVIDILSVTVTCAGGFLIHVIFMVRSEPTAHPDDPHTEVNLRMFIPPLV